MLDLIDQNKNLQNIEWKIRGAVYSANIEVKNNQTRETDPGKYAMVTSCMVASCHCGELL
jgi:hypothetical protein